MNVEESYQVQPKRTRGRPRKDPTLTDEQRREKQREYMHNYNKNYYEVNRDRIIDNKMRYYQENKAAILERASIRYYEAKEQG